MTGDRPEVAVVVQRYGADVTGGSESLARAVAERLAVDYRVTAFTTCARDYITWRNELPAGIERVGGVDVRRFRVDEERDLDSFNRFSETLYGHSRTEDDELLWLRLQGPWVPRLIEELEKDKARFDAILFFTYLYSPTYSGLGVAPERSILIPTAHDEPPLAFSIYKSVFSTPRAFVFCSSPEEALVRERFDVADRPSVVAGIGVDLPGIPDVERFRIRHDVRGPYALYAGRIDAGKGCAEMLDFYARYRRNNRGAAQLLLMGKLAMPEPTIPGVRYLGFLPEAEKAAAMAGARAIVCSSTYESLSIVLLEAFSFGTPGLVNARSAVLRDHAIRSRASLYYSDADEFAESLDLIVREERFRDVLGENGRRYVGENYRWDVVMGKYRRMIDAVSPRS